MTQKELPLCCFCGPESLVPTDLRVVLFLPLANHVQQLILSKGLASRNASLLMTAI